MSKLLGPLYIFTERLWRSVKYEEVYLSQYASPREARQGLTRYLKFYNERRPHQALGYRTPATVYFGEQTKSGKEEKSFLKASPSVS